MLSNDTVHDIAHCVDVPFAYGPAVCTYSCHTYAPDDPFIMQNTRHQQFELERKAGHAHMRSVSAPGMCLRLGNAQPPSPDAPQIPFEARQADY